MARVLIVEQDEDVRASLRAVLQMAGHDTTEAETISGALTLLHANRSPAVVLCGNDCPAHTQITTFFARIAAEATESVPARRHGYICLTTDPDRLPPPLHALLDQLAVPIMPKPFNIDPLLALVDNVAARIAREANVNRPAK